MGIDKPAAVSTTIRKRLFDTDADPDALREETYCSDR